MAVYYFTIFALTGLGYVLTGKKKETKAAVLYLAAAFLCFTFLASFRYAIGFDYFSYRDIYNASSERTLGDILCHNWHEPLFYVACLIFRRLGCPFLFFLLCINIFIFYAAMRFIFLFSKLYWVSIYLFITLQFFAYDMNLIRQAIAVSFFLLSYPYIKDQKPVPYVLWMLCGGLFHNSLLFMLPFYFLLPKRMSKKSFIAFAVLAAFSYCLFDPLFSLLLPFLPEKYSRYAKSYFWRPNSFLYVLPSAVYGIAVYWFRGRFRDPVLRSIYLNSALSCFFFSLWITKHYILERFSIYPFALSLIAIPEIIVSYQEQDADKKHQGACRFVLLFFLLYGGAYFFFAAKEGFHNVYPYVSLLAKSRSSPN